MPKKKKFIDKKNAVTFHLVHRSQRDPLQADENAPKHVLLPVREKASQIEEQQKFGVFYDDDYDYMQHLRNVSELNEVEPVQQFAHSSGATKRKNEEIRVLDERERYKVDRSGGLVLSSRVFASEVETDVGLLNKAAPLSGPQPNWDPDIVEAMDDDFDFESTDNILEDDFIAKANAVVEGEDGNDDYVSDEAEFSNDDDFGSFNEGHSFESEETKTKFTNYSVTSSVLKRNEGLTFLDDHFEKFFEQYDDGEIGALEHEDIEGAITQNNELLKNFVDDFEKKQNKPKMKDIVKKAENIAVGSGSEESDDELVKMTIREPVDKWDCESILSTYSTLYNHPKTILEPKKIKLDKQGIPMGVLNKNSGLTLKDIEKEFNSNRNTDRVCTDRVKGETLEEKKRRKQAVKEERKERRCEKKETKLAFKHEKIRQDKEIINLKTNLMGVKIT